MSLLITLVKGFAGKPSHPPLTDVSVGAYTVGVAMLVAGAAGLDQEAMSKGALLAISGGLIVAIPTALTGLLDYFDVPKRSAAHAGDLPPVRDAGGDDPVCRYVGWPAPGLSRR